MTEPRQDPDWHAPPPGPDVEQDLVPGLGRTRPLDLSQDPDRFENGMTDEAPPELPRGLDPRYDPDRFSPPGQGQSLTDLLGKEATHEGDRDGWQWVYGLVTIVAFLAIVSLLFQYVLSP